MIKNFWKIENVLHLFFHHILDMNIFIGYIGFLVVGISCLNARKHTYNLFHDCLYFVDDEMSQMGNVKANVEQTIEFCFRSSSERQDLVNEDGVSAILTFEEMREANITSENLIEWSTPIDIIEHYEIFLQTNKLSSFNNQFYLCIEPWFGRFCQYSFDFNQTLYNIAKIQFYWKAKIIDYGNWPCYIHLTCQHVLVYQCLDWREICDGKLDCFDGEDESNCLELETNQCNDNEYQCRNGMCIDKTFRLDSSFDLKSAECLDGSDEFSDIIGLECSGLLTFLCEDIVPVNTNRVFCGDGTYSPSFLPRNAYNCGTKRDRNFNYLLNWNKPNSTHFSQCFKMLVCAIGPLSNDFNRYCTNICETKQKCANQIRQLCPSAIIAPTFPVWDGHVRLGYFTNNTRSKVFGMVPDFVCYDINQCPFYTPQFLVENYTCVHINFLNLSHIDELILKFIPCQRQYDKTYCQQPNMLRCLGTNRCIPYHRIMDGIWDCYDGFDESNQSNSCILKENNRFRCSSEDKCLSPMLLNDYKNDCIDGEDESFNTDTIMTVNKLPFQAICDNWVDMTALKNNETDETNCEEWPCSNQYTRCNNVWNCRKGMDEVNCSLGFNCPPNHHPCLLPNQVEMGCLHMNFVEDGIVHCIGATDERSYCVEHKNLTLRYRRCWNETDCHIGDSLCDLCPEFNEITHVCEQATDEDEEALQIMDYLHSFSNEDAMNKRAFSHASSAQIQSLNTEDADNELEDEDEEEELDLHLTDRPTNSREIWLCNRGILIRVGSQQSSECLCSSIYYGDRCQYQSQRVSLTLQLRAENAHRLDIFAIVIRLIDHTGLIHSYDQLIFIPTLDCNTKFNLHLLYQKQPKDLTKNYTIQIDAFNKTNLTFLANWTLAIPFIFLPVNRVSTVLTIPTQYNHSTLSIEKKSNDCSSDSIYIDSANNRSICVCPLNRIGPRCLIKSICQNETCHNGGICVPYSTRESLKSFICVCPQGYSGRFCQERQVSLLISFSNIEIPEYLLLHYIYVDTSYLAKKLIQLPRTTIFKKIPYNQNDIQLSMPFPFHLIYAQISDKFYLILLQHNYTSSANYSLEISPSRYCLHTRELFNEEILQYTILHRAKYYHSLCRNHSNLVCFHDELVFMCLCTEERHANCFQFDFNMIYDCHGEKYCQNNGKCYQDHRHCPTMRMCVCQKCYYGTKCQFHTEHFDFTLDSIIAYQIHPDIPFNQQPISIHVSVSMTISMLVIVTIGGTLSIWTFQLKTCQEIGCAIYLFVSSILSIITILILNFKVAFLILTQMNLIASRSFLLFNCITMDYLLRVCLTIIDWLYAAVASERFLVAFLGIKFNKTKSKHTVKLVIIAIVLLTSLSFIHDPIHRHLLDDTEEKRIWCLARYSSNMEIYRSTINIFHFIVPFSINVLSAMGIIILTARQRSIRENQENILNQLKIQFSHHKHLLISSVSLVILTLPRLIISFLPNCMTSSRQYPIYLAAYFISFAPPLLIFFVFVLTSDKYKKECYAETKRKWILLKTQISSLRTHIL